MATKLCDEFFENYATLLRLRIDDYHERNGGEAEFINKLIICARWTDEWYSSDIRESHLAMMALEAAVTNNYFEPELCDVSLDSQLCPEYRFHFSHPDFEGNEAFDYLNIEIIIYRGGNNAYPTDYPVEILDEVSDDVWRKMIADVNGELSFGTLLGAPVPLED